MILAILSPTLLRRVAKPAMSRIEAYFHAFSFFYFNTVTNEKENISMSAESCLNWVVFCDKIKTLSLFCETNEWGKILYWNQQTKNKSNLQNYHMVDNICGICP